MFFGAVQASDLGKGMVRRKDVGVLYGDALPLGLTRSGTKLFRRCRLKKQVPACPQRSPLQDTNVLPPPQVLSLPPKMKHRTAYGGRNIHTASVPIHQTLTTHQFASPHLQFSLAIGGFRDSLRRRHERQVMSRRPLTNAGA